MVASSPGRFGSGIMILLIVLFLSLVLFCVPAVIIHKRINRFVGHMTKTNNMRNILSPHCSMSAWVGRGKTMIGELRFRQAFTPRV